MSVVWGCAALPWKEGRLRAAAALHLRCGMQESTWCSGWWLSGKGGERQNNCRMLLGVQMQYTCKEYTESSLYTVQVHVDQYMTADPTAVVMRGAANLHLRSLTWWTLCSATAKPAEECRQSVPALQWRGEREVGLVLVEAKNERSRSALLAEAPNYTWHLQWISTPTPTFVWWRICVKLLSLSESKLKKYNSSIHV